MATIKLTDDYEELDLKIGKTGDVLNSVILKLDTTITVPLYLYLYAPNGDYLGGIWNVMTSMPTCLILGSSFWSLNGKRSTLTGGFYRLVMTGIRQTGLSTGVLSYESDLSLEDCSRFAGELPAGFILTEHDVQRVERLTKEQEAIIEHQSAEDQLVAVQTAGMKLFKGDFHSHTFFSDGHMNYAEASEVIAAQRLDFIALTEHNAIDLNACPFGAVVLPSFELTLPKGHFNIHGIPRDAVISETSIHYLNTLQSIDALEANRILRQYQPNAFITLNHMFMEPWHCQDSSLDMQLIDAIEVICDPTYPTAAQANDRAIRFLDFLWQKGVRIFGVGGSDSHNCRGEYYESAVLPSIYGDPATYVYSESLEADALLSNASLGRMIVSRFVKLNVMINAGEILPGQWLKIEANKTIQYTVTIDWPDVYEGIDAVELLRDAKCQFIVNGAVSEQATLVKDRVYQMTVSVNATQDFWMRFGIIDGSGHVIAYVNPIYSRRESVPRMTYNTYLEEFDNIND
ncbi:CehA/McbA family metallohydrolase [Fusibacter paucivorans]|uniref:CehA/McbA family metallohydrolase n=1 Tax=Fusibacter paucivorans TaxID=76009 RepID=A0ABS5PKD6_9FIRM|nr:CehA/McbA family metallohydrolase [Fusibacter paucivorans]MBS7525342.1 CehA/McbA family metallohydrolase [Fusibacter paucivorans]